MRSTYTLIAFIFLLGLGFASQAQDQGLRSILLIIDRAINEIEVAASDQGNADPEASATAVATASSAVVNLSRTLGTLSFSRLQCGEAAVLADFTLRVQKMPETSRDAMRDAFQEGFDKSAKESVLLSDDECKRLTQSRQKTEQAIEANVLQDPAKTKQEAKEKAVEKPAEDPNLKHLRMAELGGQLAFKREFCEGHPAFHRELSSFLKTVPKDAVEDATAAYWKGYRHGKRLNQNISRAGC